MEQIKRDSKMFVESVRRKCGTGPAGRERSLASVQSRQGSGAQHTQAATAEQNRLNRSRSGQDIITTRELCRMQDT